MAPSLSLMQFSAALAEPLAKQNPHHRGSTEAALAAHIATTLQRGYPSLEPVPGTDGDFRLPLSPLEHWRVPASGYELARQWKRPPTLREASAAWTVQGRTEYALTGGTLLSRYKTESLVETYTPEDFFALLPAWEAVQVEVVGRQGLAAGLPIMPRALPELCTNVEVELTLRREPSAEGVVLRRPSGVRLRHYQESPRVTFHLSGFLLHGGGLDRLLPCLPAQLRERLLLQLLCLRGRLELELQEQAASLADMPGASAWHLGNLSCRAIAAYLADGEAVARALVILAAPGTAAEEAVQRHVQPLVLERLAALTAHTVRPCR